MSTDAKASTAPKTAVDARAAVAAVDAELAPGTSLDRIDRIRDILFGREMRDYEKKLAALEDRLHKDSRDIRDDLSQRIDALEEYAKKEIDAGVAKLKAEQKKREEDVDDLSDRIKSSSNSLERKVEGVEETVSDNHRDLRDQILTQSKTLNEEIRRRVTQFEETLERHVSELRTDKMDRAALAALLKEMSMRINRELDTLDLQ